MSMTGNLAKLQIIQELAKMFKSEPSRVLRILDAGITGPNPLNIWKTLFEYTNFELTGIDIDAESIERLKKEDLPVQLSSLETLSGYDIASRFGEKSFDAIVSTQVLEHMKYPDRFLEAALTTLKKGGVLYLCYDSGDYPRKRNIVRETMKDAIVLVTKNERYHDKDITTVEAVKMLENAGFRIEDQRHYNIHPLKAMHNHELSDEKKDAFLALWKHMEDWLNNNGHASANPERYMGAYFKAVKP